MKKIILATTLVATVLASAVSANANRYIDPKAPFDGYKFFQDIANRASQ